MKKRLLGIFDTKKLTPEQIYERTMNTIEENARLELLAMAKVRGKEKKKREISSKLKTIKTN